MKKYLLCLSLITPLLAMDFDEEMKRLEAEEQAEERKQANLRARLEKQAQDRAHAQEGQETEWKRFHVTKRADKLGAKKHGIELGEKHTQELDQLAAETKIVKEDALRKADTMRVKAANLKLALVELRAEAARKGAISQEMEARFKSVDRALAGVEDLVE